MNLSLVWERTSLLSCVVIVKQKVYVFCDTLAGYRRDNDVCDFNYLTNNVDIELYFSIRNFLLIM